MGSYKAARRSARADGGKLSAVPLELTWYDEHDVEHEDVFQCYGEPHATTFLDGAHFQSLGVEDPAAIAFTRRVLVECIGDEAEFDRFWRAASNLTMEELNDVMGVVLQDTMGRPTPSQSVSPEPSAKTTDSGPTSNADGPLPPGITREGLLELIAQMGEAPDEQTPVKSSQEPTLPARLMPKESRTISLDDRTVTPIRPDAQAV